MQGNLYKRFYGQGSGGYTAEHQLQGRVRRSEQGQDPSGSQDQYVPKHKVSIIKDGPSEDEIFEAQIRAHSTSGIPDQPQAPAQQPVQPTPPPMAPQAPMQAQAPMSQPMQPAPAQVQPAPMAAQQSGFAQRPGLSPNTVPKPGIGQTAVPRPGLAQAQQQAYGQPQPVQPQPYMQQPVQPTPPPMTAQQAQAPMQQPIQPVPAQIQPPPMAAQAPVQQPYMQQPVPQPVQPQPQQAQAPMQQPIQPVPAQIQPPPMAAQAPVQQPMASAVPPQNDDLLALIDEFRAKAQQLEELIARKEQRAEALRAMAAGGEAVYGGTIVNNVDTSEIVNQVNMQIAALQNQMNQQLFCVSEDMKASMAQIAQSAGGAGAGIDPKQIESIVTQIDSIKGNVDGLREKLESKVHSESVASYRNLADLIKGLETGHEDDGKANQVLLKEVRSQRSSLRVAMVFGIVNFALIAILSLYSMEIITFF